MSVGSPEVLKKTIGGDTLCLKTLDNASALGEIRSTFGIEGSCDGDEILIETQNGETFIPDLVSGLKIPILEISMRRPTLEDVFLKLTGHEIREDVGGEAVLRREWTLRQAGTRGGKFH